MASITKSKPELKSSARLSSVTKSSISLTWQVGLICVMRSCKAVTFALPNSLVKAGSWRLILDSATLSKSIKVSCPMPVRARASTAHEPTPPTPTTQIWAWAKRCNAVSPYKRAMPPKRRLRLMFSLGWVVCVIVIGQNCCKNG